MIWHGHRAVRQAVYDVYGSVEHRDLGSVAADIRKIVNAIAPQLKPGNHIVVRGQIQSMHSAFGNLTLGLLFAAVFVYMLMVVNYQSFLDPLAVLLALPGAGTGILLMLFVAGTTISVPSLMGSIMAIGVASANSILLVTFARELRATGMSTFQAALSAGTTRLRPVLMTVAAMPRMARIGAPRSLWFRRSYRSGARPDRRLHAGARDTPLPGCHAAGAARPLDI